LYYSKIILVKIITCPEGSDGCLFGFSPIGGGGGKEEEEEEEEEEEDDDGIDSWEIII